MRSPFPLLALAAALATTGACHKAQPPASNLTPIQPAAVATTPAPGLWREVVSDRHGAQETRFCLDSAAAASFAAFNQSLTGRCTRHDMARAADGSWRFATRCDMGAWGEVATDGVVRGDFASHYVVEATTQTVGAARSAANGPGRLTADVRRVGDCPRDMQPGDVVLPNGARVRLEQIAGHA